jgi:hypothetical protein
METKVKVDGSTKKRVDKVLEDIELSKKSAEEKQGIVQFLGKDEVLQKLRTGEPFISHLSYYPLDKVKFWVINPDVSRKLTSFIFFGPANFVQNDDQALLSADARYPAHYQTEYAGVDGLVEFEFDISFFYNGLTHLSEKEMMANYFVGSHNYFDPGKIYDRGSIMIPLPSPW